MAKKTKPNRDIKEATKALRELMVREMSVIAENMVNDLMKEYNRAMPSQRINATKKVSPKGVSKYKEVLLKAVSELGLDALEKAQIGAPKETKIKLAMPTEFKKLPPELQKKIKRQLDLTIDAQIADITKEIFFQYTDSVDSIDSASLVRADLEEAAEDFILGNAIRAGASAMASKTVNEARSAFFFQDDTLEQIEAFRFVNGDPKSPICQDLATTVFKKDDPELFRYTPPLHFNCKSYIEPIYKGEKVNKPITKLKPSKKSLEKYIQFNEA